MIEQAPGNPQTDTEMAPILAIGGLLSVKRQWPFYRPLLKDSDCELPVSDRFFPVPDRGLGTMEETYGQLEEKLTKTHERLDGERAVLAGHSLGGLMATMLALEHPDKVSGVVCIAGAQEGIKRETLSSLALRLALRHPPGEEHIQHDSDFMVDHKRRIAAEWSPDISLHLVSPTYDDLLLHPQGLRLELPEEQTAQRRIISPFGTGFLFRRIPGMPKDIQFINSLYPVGHIDSAVSPPLLAYTRKVRQGAAEYSRAELTTLPIADSLPLAA